MFQRTDQLQNAADVIDGGTADLLGALHYDLRTDPVPGEQFLQQRAVFLIADQVAAAYPAAARFDGAAQKTHGTGIVIALCFQRFDARLGFIRKKFWHNHALIVHDAL